MARPVRAVLKKSGMRKLLNGDASKMGPIVNAAIARAYKQARIGYSGIDPEGYERPPVVDVTSGPNKGRRRYVGRVIVVHPLAADLEARYRILGRALLATKV